MSARNDPFPIGIVEIFYASLGKIAGVEIRLINIRAQRRRAVAAGIGFQSFLGQDLVGENLRSFGVGCFIRQRQ